MTGLVTFLRARLDEDEAEARRVLAYEPVVARFREVRWERQLREVQAKRAILARHLVDERYSTPSCMTCGDGWDGWEPVQEDWPCATLRTLISVYSDHTDYDSEWKP